MSQLLTRWEPLTGGTTNSRKDLLPIYLRLLKQTQVSLKAALPSHGMDKDRRTWNGSTLLEASCSKVHRNS